MESALAAAAVTTGETAAQVGEAAAADEEEGEAAAAAKDFHRAGEMAERPEAVKRNDVEVLQSQVLQMCKIVPWTPLKKNAWPEEMSTNSTQA